MRNLKYNNVTVQNVKYNNTQVQTVKYNNVIVWLNKVWTYITKNLNIQTGGQNVYTWYSGNVGTANKKKNLHFIVSNHFYGNLASTNALFFEGSNDNINWFAVYPTRYFDTPSHVGNSMYIDGTTTNGLEFLYFRVRVMNHDGAIHHEGLKILTFYEYK